ncbi:hypothetical protein L6164_004807 [Bauhinia variegata]|uniref:Uncharacterized protein n=1 Tax=Bauhinia variegata TaxID=167791 RepID=A0ACB9PPH3_BAUVA|nr:hypothetical protein L6164_004807 [Bauhinia variegata]
MVNRDTSNRDEKRVVLENLVNDTPCCSGILVDRGFGQKLEKEQRLAMFYIGGPDDREALSYAWRMSRNLDVQLTVVRLIWDNPNAKYDETDDGYLRCFRNQNLDIASVRYLERIVKDESETVALLNKMGAQGFDLSIIGRGHGRVALAQTLDPVLEEPALSPLGDALADLNTAAETSILIIQTQASEYIG